MSQRILSADTLVFILSQAVIRKKIHLLYTF